jgi:carboxymethylenebutenolidase
MVPRMALSDYIAEEVAEECVAGFITRREALRRLGLLGLSMTAAGTLLAACGDDDDDTATDTTAPADSSTTPTTGASSAGEEAEIIEFAGPAGTLTASFAAATDPKGAVLIVHENRGLTPHFRALPLRLAGDGYTALCVDLLSRQGGTASLTDEGAAQAGLSAAAPADLIADLQAGIGELEKRAEGQKVAAMGFCFGGGMVWQLLNAGETRLAAAVPFYGPAPDAPDFTRVEAAVLAIYGETDDRVNATRERAQAALEAAGLEHEIRTFTGAGHAFFNDTGERYNATAAAEAYTEVLAWFGKYLT